MCIRDRPGPVSRPTDPITITAVRNRFSQTRAPAQTCPRPTENKRKSQ